MTYANPHNFSAQLSFIRTMFSKKGFLFFILVAAIGSSLLLNSSCRKEQFGNGSLSFSTDTLTFDTVFTSLGSTTKYFKVFNTDKKAVRIQNIQLMHLVGTQFRINVDGVSGDQFTDIEIPAKDSIYVFVEVTVNPNSATTPFVIIDDVSFMINGNTSTVHLQAFGQNAHYHYGEEILNGESKTWSNDLPHVIISHDTVPGVLIDCGATLTIQPGAKIFFAGNSAIFVQGTLNAVSTSWADSIVFQGVRLESFYADKPGQWFGIVFLRSNDCVPQGFFNHCVINESTYGIYAGAGLSTNFNDYLDPLQRPDVVIQNSIVKNSGSNAVYGFNAKIVAENCLFYAAGENLVKFGLGGEYSFLNCTMYNTGSRFIEHKNETLLLSNLLNVNNTDIYHAPLKTDFKNCVVYGSLQNEVSFNNYYDDTLTEFDNSFSYSLVKTKQDTFEMFTNVHNNMLYNQEPLFKNAEEGNFTPRDSSDANFKSPLIDAGTSGPSPDIFGTPRPSGAGFDIGAVEKP
jgi:hypothetical protein